MTTQAFRSSFDDTAVAEADNEVLRGWLRIPRTGPSNSCDTPAAVGAHPQPSRVALAPVLACY
jgi:hypothetical protein